MAQRDPWEREYQDPKLVSMGDEPQRALLDCLKHLRRKEGLTIDGARVLDLGSGVGKNAIHLAKLGSEVHAIEISQTAINIAKERTRTEKTEVDFIRGSIGKHYPFEDASFDLILDIMSSNSLNEKERDTYLRESHRVLKPGGHMIMRGLCKDGDKNAKELLKRRPGKERDTYVMPGMDLTERVFTREDFIATYSPFFEILELEKKENYARVEDRLYKRNYWLAMLKRKAA
jgi:ubiquinone/menaquinone biosynthesis C-methylase UbiE